MKTDATPHIVALDRMHNGLFVFFEDGSKGSFSNSLLYDSLAAADPVAEAGPDPFSKTPPTP